MPPMLFVPRHEIRRIIDTATEMTEYQRLSLVADICRLNALAAVKRAGSGHLGSSFSAMEIVVWLYYHELNTAEAGLDDPHRDIYFSSKGHDVPGLYAVLHSLGLIPEDKLLKLRRLGGLDGHPNVGTPGIEANTGSLGMGIAKGRGMAWAKRHRGLGGRVFVMTGDGELQEGQVYESLQATVHQGIDNLFVIVDHNKLQTDKYVREIIDLGDLEAKFRAFGWFVARCDGHDLQQLDASIEAMKAAAGRPKILIADTIKGRGVSFMEHPWAMEHGGGLYRWHSGAPADPDYAAAYDEILSRVNRRLGDAGLSPTELKDVTPETAPPSGVTRESVAAAFGQALVELARERDDIVVLDGDLAMDCRVREFEETYPDRFIENGIAEQDMVSMAGGLARMGLLPVVNSFASFLSSRANEQIYNNATERTKIIYAFHFAGLIPAGPGKSHQSVRDISLLGALPNCEIIQPCNAEEARQALSYCVNDAPEVSVLRLVIGPSPRAITLPPGYRLARGRGAVLCEGDDAVIFAYGPVMLHEALVASELLRERGFGLRVVNMPWLNRVDPAWLAEVIRPSRDIYVLEDHSPVGGLGDRLLRELEADRLLDGRRVQVLGLDQFPACGTPAEVLAHHGLDGASLARRIEPDAAPGQSDLQSRLEPGVTYTAESPQ